MRAFHTGAGARTEEGDDEGHSDAEADQGDVEAVVSNLHKAMTSEINTSAAAAAAKRADTTEAGAHVQRACDATHGASEKQQQQQRGDGGSQADTPACDTAINTATAQGEDALGKHVLEVRPLLRLLHGVAWRALSLDVPHWLFA